MKVLVCGGRGFCDREMMDRELGRLAPTLIIEGGAPGADTLADEWALANGVHTARVNALWTVHRRAAGPIRNAVMLSLQPDLVVAFPGGRGTADMVRRAKAAGVPVREITSDKSGEVK